MGTFQAPSEALVAEKAAFGASRLERWFGRAPVGRVAHAVLAKSREYQRSGRMQTTISFVPSGLVLST